MHFNGSQVDSFFLNYDVFLSLEIVLILPNSADPDEMQHNAAFHLGLHCLPKCSFMGFPAYKGLFTVEVLSLFMFNTAVIKNRS